ncbi:MAG: DUF1343 domain-containing protein [Thermoanaerobaculia bacterium]
MTKPTPVVLGIENLAANPAPLQAKRVAVLSHQAAVTHDLRRAIDVVHEIAGDDRFVRIFGPEHGFWGVKQDMEGATSEIDSATGKEIVSLYVDYPKQPKERTPEGLKSWKGELEQKKKQLWPKAKDLQDVEVLVVDLQDVGARFYTFANTMAYCMEVAKTTGTKVVVCDRPNPIGGRGVEGNLFEEGDRWMSFVGQFNIAPRHGMTIGELARYYRDLHPKYACDLEVIPMTGWTRGLWWDQTDLPWVPPSPNMPTIATAAVYPGMCLIEATMASEGRGTTIPFEIFGAPHVDPFVLASRLNEIGLAGIRFRPQFFQPTFQKHGGKVCGGVQLHVTDREALQSYRLGLWCTKVIHDLWKDFEWRHDAYEYEEPNEKHALEQLVGSPQFREIVEKGGDLDAWIESWDLSEFLARRNQALETGYGT